MRIREDVPLVNPRNVIPLLAFCLSLLAPGLFNQLRSLALPKLGDMQVAQASAL